MNDKERAEALDPYTRRHLWSLPDKSLSQAEARWLISALESAQAESAQLRAELQEARKAIWGLQGGMKWVPEENYRRLKEAAQEVERLLTLDDPPFATDGRRAMDILAAALSEAPATEGSPRAAPKTFMVFSDSDLAYPAHPAEAPAQEEDR